MTTKAAELVRSAYNQSDSDSRLVIILIFQSHKAFSNTSILQRSLNPSQTMQKLYYRNRFFLVMIHTIC